MASNAAGPTNQLEEMLIFYNPREDDSDSISTKLSTVIAEEFLNQNGIGITKISNTSTAEEKRQEQKISSHRVAILLVITKDLLFGEERVFLDAMVDAAVRVADSSKILTVYYKVHPDRIPQRLRVNMLDYDTRSFNADIHKAVKALAAIAEETQGMEAYRENGLRRAQQALQKDTLEAIRMAGGDVRGHIADAVQGLNAENDEFLRDLGPGSIMEESQGPSATDSDSVSVLNSALGVVSIREASTADDSDYEVEPAFP